MWSRPRLSTRSRVRGVTLTELMVALVISSLAALAIYGAFSSVSSVTSQTRAQDSAWQQARTAMTMLTQAIEGAGYGLPMNECGGGIYTNVAATSTSTTTAQYTVSTSSPSGGLFLTPVAAVAQTAANPYDYSPGSINTYALTTVAGGSPFGSAPVTTITKTSGKSVTSVNFFVSNASLLQSMDIFLIPLPNSSCIMGQVTNSNPGGGSNVVGNPGQSTFNAPKGFSATDPGITTSQLINRGVINLGNTGFRIQNFFIGDGSGAQVPSLYMQTYTYLNGAPNTPAPPVLLVARGIIDMQIAFGYGQNGVVSHYALPGTPPPAGMTPADLLTVQVALLVRGTRTIRGSYAGSPPSTVVLNGSTNPALPAATYQIPTNLPAGSTMGCVAGNCSHYVYRVFTSVIPVRNDIWGQ